MKRLLKLLMGASKNSAADRLVRIFTPIEKIFRRNNWFISREIDDEWGKRHAKMAGAKFLEVP